MTERKGFLSRMFREEQGDDDTRVFSRREIGAGEEPREVEQHPHGFTVERAAEIINELPPEVPRQSAFRIVRQTLIAAGIDVAALESSTRARESKLGSEIELSRQRIQDLENRTKEVVSSLEDQIRKAREARDYGVREEEDRISHARESLDDIAKVRDFFGLPEEEEPSEETTAAPEEAPGEEDTTDDASAGDETQVMERVDQDDTQVLRPRGPLSRGWETGGGREDRDP